MEPANKKRISRRTAFIAAAVMMFAAPAVASILIQNYMEADISATPACFVKVAGDDVTNSALATFTDTGTISVDGADLVEEKITLTGQIGDRVVFTDVVRYQNTCTEDIDVTLRATAASGDWDDRSAEVWLSNIADPADIDPNADPTDDWKNGPIAVSAGGGISQNVTGPVVSVAPGSELQGAFITSTGTTATGTATLNWIAEAKINTTP